MDELLNAQEISSVGLDDKIIVEYENVVEIATSEADKLDEGGILNNSKQEQPIKSEPHITKVGELNEIGGPPGPTHSNWHENEENIGGNTTVTKPTTPNAVVTHKIISKSNHLLKSVVRARQNSSKQIHNISQSS